MRRLIVIATYVVLGVALLGADVTKAELKGVGLQSVKEGTKIIDFELEDLQGVHRKLSDYDGKIVFLNFWATWCGPCRAEMPSMQSLYDQLNDDGFAIVAVDVAENPRDVQKFVKEMGLTFDVLLDRDGRVGGSYGARSIPTTYIIDREGTIIAGRIGGQEWDGPEVVAFFRDLLAEE